MPAYPFDGVMPRIEASAWLAPGARVSGDVTIGADSSVWYNVVVRGDVMPTRIGARSNIQDGSVVHVTTDLFATEIGDDVLVGHMAMIHGCTLQDRCFIGMSAVVMDGCVVESEAMLAAGALLTPGQRMGARELWIGRPARFHRMLRDSEVERNAMACARYVGLARRHADSQNSRHG